MTGVAPQGPIPVSQTPGDPSVPSPSLSWEGDKMFNIYIYDYCYKRGFRKTARELLLEAEIPSDSTPPINARQGLLFEWWSVFWVLFTAKANGNGTEDAMLYTQHQAHLTTMKQNHNRGPPPPMPPSQMQPIGRGGVNGLGPQRPFAPNGVMPNGIPPGNGQPSGPTAFVGGPMQPNGIMSGPPAQPGMGQQSFMQQRPPMGGPPRAPNGGPPFQSPTMAHSPPNPGQQPQPPQQHPAPPMGQLGPPHRGGGMLPPGQGMNPGQQTPTSSYQNLTGRPPSRTSTPQGMINPSPSMAPRQPMVPGNDPRQEMAVNNELQAIPIQIINMLKNELSIGDRNIHSLTFQDKSRILQLHRQRSQKPGPPPNNAAAGPSMQAPPPRRANKRNSTSPGEDQQQPDDGRNGSSPPDRKRVRRSPQEPQLPQPPMNPYQQHPNQPPQPQPGGPGGPGGPQQPMGNGMMRPMSGPMNGGFPQQGQPNMQQQMAGPMGMLGMNPMMSNSMPNSMPNTMSPQMHAQPTMYRQPMQHNLQHPNRMAGMNAGSPGSDPSFNPGVPMPPGAGGPGGQQQPGGQFAPGSRLSGPPNSKPMSMLPPPSPAKDQNGPNKDNKGPSNGHPDGSPRNQPLSGPNPPGTAPPTPVPNQGQGQPGQNQNMAPSPGLLMNPGSASMNSVAMPLPPAAPSASGDLFSNDFIQSVANGLDEFDVGLFRGDGDINFERDFGQWFNPDDVGSMELGKQ